MNLDDLDGTRLERAAADVLAGGDRAELYRALLDSPVAVLHPGPAAPPGPTTTLPGIDAPVVLASAMALGAPVTALFASGARARSEAVARGTWPDGVERARVFAPATLFPSLKLTPGAVLLSAAGPVALDGGEIAALAEKQLPDEYAAALHKLVAAGRGREVARRLQGRMLYVLSERNAPVTIQHEFPVFLHLSAAVAVAIKMGETTGTSPSHGVVAATELFAYAVRSRYAVLINPGPSSMRLRYTELK